MKSKLPVTFVCAGGGGVGKTSTSAALALVLARRGAKVLLVTVDPARRLADAMGVIVDERVQPVSIDEGAKGRLFCLMPEPSRSMDTFVDVLFAEKPDESHRVKKNPIYRAMATGAASMHEIVSLILLAAEVERNDYDAVVLDTAPSRNALDFISYPARLATLFEGRAVGWLAGVAERVSRDKKPGFFASAQERVEQLFSRIIRPELLNDLASLFGELGLVKERFASLSRIAERLLLGDGSRYVLVAGPTRASVADIAYLRKRLEKLGVRARAVVCNRADSTQPAWLLDLEAHTHGQIGTSIAYAKAAYADRVRRGDELDREITKILGGTTRIRTSSVDAHEPVAVVKALAEDLSTKLGSLVDLPTK